MFMIHVDSDVPLVTDAKVFTTPARELAEGDVIAVPFAGYADLLCAVTEVGPPRTDGLIELTVSDGQLSYTHLVAEVGDVIVYPANQKGQVRS